MRTACKAEPDDLYPGEYLHKDPINEINCPKCLKAASEAVNGPVHHHNNTRNPLSNCGKTSYLVKIHHLKEEITCGLTDAVPEDEKPPETP